MLTRLYVDNYKAFSNFEYRPKANELLLGRNGTGKSSVFEVVGMLRRLVVEGASVADALEPGTLTRWDSRDTQRFELEVPGIGGEYRYELSVEYTDDRDKWRIGQEALGYRTEAVGSWGPLFSRSRDEAHLYRDDHREGRPVLIDWNRSGVHVIQPGRHNTRLTWFRERLARVHCVQIDPHRMGAETDAEASSPSEGLANYASWYRHLLQEDPNVSMALRGHLAEVIDGLDSLDLRQSGGRSRTLSAAIRQGGDLLDYSFADLSDGQRAPIGLYTIAAVLGRVAAAGRPAVTFCLDEPENYVALAELQPWIHEIEDAADGVNAQVLVASHHPEFINHYAHTDATLFYREDGGPCASSRSRHRMTTASCRRSW